MRNYLKTKLKTLLSEPSAEPEIIIAYPPAPPKNPIGGHAVDPFLSFAPPGHFYSPLPSIEEVKELDGSVFNTGCNSIPGIDLNVERQVEFLELIKDEYENLDLCQEQREDRRFYLRNNEYSWGDAAVLACLLKRMLPCRLIEVGCGYSSAVILDTNELSLDGRIDCTFIDPDPHRLLQLANSDLGSLGTIRKESVQDVPVEVFERLLGNDFLVIDSSHVSKVGSDVNYIIFEILPRLRPGVFVHFHDVFWPFTYPKNWCYQGIAWNEAYLLRAFLQYNNDFEIVFFSDYLRWYHWERFAGMPIFDVYCGQSLWLRRRA